MSHAEKIQLYNYHGPSTPTMVTAALARRGREARPRKYVVTEVRREQIDFDGPEGHHHHR